MLHWPDGGESDQLRYSLSDHLGSSVLELDDGAGILSQEHYYPFGGTACWAGKSAVAAKSKTIRYSGKERDSTGLYYYGYRYYASWLQRWISADPAGPVNGLNIFIFVSNNPVNLKDVDGRIYQGKNDRFEQDPASGNILARGLDSFPPEQQSIITTAFSEVEYIYATAEAAVSSDLVDHARILHSFFGSEYEAVKSKVLDAFARGKEWAKKYQEPWGRDRIVGVDSVKWLAVVNSADSHGRIFIRIDQLDSNTLSSVVGHEVTHLKQVEGIVGSGTKDYFYLPLRSRRIASEIAMRGELTDWIVKTMSEVGGVNDFVRGVERFGGHSAFTLDVDTAASIFNQNPLIRAQMAAENADSIMAAATELSHRFADSQEFHKLLYG
jgi:insecticidal toxin complex protein TccC